MIYTLSAEVLEKTNCLFDYSCLATGKCGNREMCETEYADGLNVLFLNTKEAAECIHRKEFGSYQICNCPAHYAIHKKYSRPARYLTPESD
jgi:hypothetical protein